MSDYHVEDIVPLRKFEKIDRKIPMKQGLLVLFRRLGTSGAGVQRELYQRHPYRSGYIARGVRRYRNIRCFLAEDIVFTDILHVTYEEMKNLGIGRRYLMNRLLRVILSGMCDSIDPSGKSGDFPNRLSMTADESRLILRVQRKCLSSMKTDKAGLLQSLKVRMRRISTHVLLALVKSEGAIRREIRKRSEDKPFSGIEAFSDMLSEIKGKFVFNVNKSIITRRKKASKIRCDNKAACAQRNYRILRMCITDLKRILDPGVKYWYRRPTDEDWNEGSRGSQRTPRTMDRKKRFRRYGMADIPGITVPIRPEDWSTVRTDWRMSELKTENYNGSGHRPGYSPSGSSSKRKATVKKKMHPTTR